MIRQFIRALGTQPPPNDELVIYFNYSLLRKRKLWYSISNSPYPAHVLRTAVDIYSEYPYLPVMEGFVRKIIRIPSGFKVSNSEFDEWVIIISLPDGENVLKVLHVKPSVRIGEKLYLGDELGKFVRTYHFYSWTEPHMHVELRKATDPVRALGGYQLFPENELLNVLREYRCTDKEEYIVSSVREKYCLLKPVVGGYPCAQTLDLKGFIDGGLPHYGYASIFLVSQVLRVRSNKVTAGEYMVGELTYLGKYSSIFKPIAKPSIAGTEWRGVGYFLMRSEIKLINNGLRVPLAEGDVIKLSWVTKPNIMGNKYLKLLKMYSQKNLLNEGYGNQ